MAEQKTSPLLWLGLIGGGVALWWYMKNKGAAAAVPGTALLPAAQPSNQAPNPTQLLPVANTPIVQAPAASQILMMQTPGPVAASAASAPNGIDPTVYTTVANWVVEDGNKPPKVAMVQAAVPAEFDGMYDLITNVWDKGLQPDPEQVDFWNNLRAKYDPNHVYW